MPIFRMALTFEDEKMEIYPTLQDLEDDVHNIVNVITNTLQVSLGACTSQWGENDGTYLVGCEIDPQGVQTIDSWQGQATPSFVDVKVADRVLDWAHNILKTTVCKNLEEPNKLFQYYGNFPKSSDFASSTHYFFYPVILTYFLYFTVDKYAWLVNGTALAQVEKFMEEEHSFEEYAKVTNQVYAVYA